MYKTMVVSKDNAHLHSKTKPNIPKNTSMSKLKVSEY